MGRQQRARRQIGVRRAVGERHDHRPPVRPAGRLVHAGRVFPENNHSPGLEGPRVAGLDGLRDRAARHPVQMLRALADLVLLPVPGHLDPHAWRQPAQRRHGFYPRLGRAFGPADRVLVVHRWRQKFDRQQIGVRGVVQRVAEPRIVGRFRWCPAARRGRRAAGRAGDRRPFGRHRGPWIPPGRRLGTAAAIVGRGGAQVGNLLFQRGNPIQRFVRKSRHGSIYRPAAPSNQQSTISNQRSAIPVS